MLKIFVKNGLYDVDIDLKGRLGIVLGNSGTGKTFLGKFLKTAYNLKHFNTEPKGYDYFYVDDINTLKGIDIKNRQHSFIFIDAIEQWDDDSIQVAGELIIYDLVDTNKDNYYLIMYRGVSLFATLANSWYHLMYDNNTFYLKEVPKS